jgi:hypothetical protein
LPISVPVFALTAYEIVPLFVPAEPVLIAIHDTSAVAVQLHVDTVFIDALNVPPLAGTCCDVGESANEHDPVGVVGDELWPHSNVVKSTSRPTIEAILIDLLVALVNQQVIMERDSCARITARSCRTLTGIRSRALASTWLENASSDDDTMTIGTFGSLERISRHSSAPNKPGMCQSMIIRRGWNACIVLIARRPFPVTRTS